MTQYKIAPQFSIEPAIEDFQLGRPTFGHEPIRKPKVQLNTKPAIRIIRNGVEIKAKNLTMRAARVVSRKFKQKIEQPKVYRY